MRWGSGYEDRGLVFARENGTPLAPGGVSKAFTRTLGAAGLPVIRFHDLRHTHASLALAASVPVTVVSKRLGHSTIAITVDTYAHLIPDEDVAAAQTFEAHVLGGGAMTRTG